MVNTDGAYNFVEELNIYILFCSGRHMLSKTLNLFSVFPNVNVDVIIIREDGFGGPASPQPRSEAPFAV